MPHGRVIWQLPNGGLRMDGMFRMGHPHGYARIFDERGDVLYDGRFVNGRPKAKHQNNGFEVETFSFNRNGGGGGEGGRRAEEGRKVEPPPDDKTL
jgi:antitoxin component YwqK of YwqJK toxin-antitoxin module